MASNPSDTVADVFADPMGFLAREMTRGVKRSWNLTRHMLGIDRAATGATPRDAVWRSGKSVLYRYRSDAVTVGEPLLLVMSLVSRSFILDLQPGNSFVEHLRDAGFDVFLLDWGVPDEAEAGFDLSTYADILLPAAVAEADRLGGHQGVNVFGYCYGGVLSLLYASRHTSDPINTLTVMATPVDFAEMPAALGGVGRHGVDPQHLLDHTGNVPAPTVRAGFIGLSPTADLTTVVDFWEHLEDDRFLSNYQAMTSWTRNHIPFPGAAFVQSTEVLVDGNGFVNDDIVIDGRPRHLADITVPFHNVIAERDHIVPPTSTRGLGELVGSVDVTETELPAGHVGLIVGSGGRRRCMPAMSEWIAARSRRLDEPRSNQRAHAAAV